MNIPSQQHRGARQQIRIEGRGCGLMARNPSRRGIAGLSIKGWQSNPTVVQRALGSDWHHDYNIAAFCAWGLAVRSVVAQLEMRKTEQRA